MDFFTQKPLNINSIRNIIFDFGGVIINIDYKLTTKAFEKLGVRNFDDLFCQASQSHLFDRLETGSITPADFRKELRQIIQLNIPDYDLDAAWNAMLLDYPKHRLDFLLEIKSRYRTFLLSNTNQIHQDAYMKSLYEQHERIDLGMFFEKVYLSHEVGLRKPGSDIYQMVLDQNGLKAEETLFIDDTAHNLTSPAHLGIQVYHLANGEDIVEFAERAGLK